VTFVVAGARTTIEDPESVLARARRWGSDHGADVLLADARAVFGRDHLISAALHAERARSLARMTARSVALEALLYLSGRRQVADAIRSAGLRGKTKGVAIVIFDGTDGDAFLRSMGWTRDDTTLDARGKSLRLLGIGSREETTIPPGSRPDLALEKVALVDVLK